MEKNETSTCLRVQVETVIFWSSRYQEISSRCSEILILKMNKYFQKEIIRKNEYGMFLMKGHIQPFEMLIWRFSIDNWFSHSVRYTENSKIITVELFLDKFCSYRFFYGRTFEKFCLHFFLPELSVFFEIWKNFLSFTFILRSSQFKSTPKYALPLTFHKRSRKI